MRRKQTRVIEGKVVVLYIWVCVFLTWPCREVGIRGMNRRYGSGYGSRASELLLCGFGHCKAPVRWQLDSRENLDRLVATSQPGALVGGLN